MNKIPLSVSSSLTNVPSTAALMVTPYGNQTGKTGEAAPVLIAVESEGTVDAAAFAAALPAKGGQGTASQARLVVNAISGVLSDLVAEYGAITVNTPFGRVDTFVAGSLEYATDPVDPAVNVPFLGIVPGADVMKAFSQIETYVPASACPASLKRIRDVATEDHAIHGTNPFYAQGYGMTTGGTGETVKLLNLLTRAEICSVAVDAATKSEAQFKCTLPGSAAIPAGKYLLQIMTLAGGETALWPLELPVTLAEAVIPIPTITKVTQTTDGAPDGKISYLDDRARLYIQNMPGVENPENEISVTWTKADSSTIVKGRSQIDFLDVSNGYIKPEVPEDLAVGDRLTVKATYNGVDTNVKTVTVVTSVVRSC